MRTFQRGWRWALWDPNWLTWQRLLWRSSPMAKSPCWQNMCSRSVVASCFLRLRGWLSRAQRVVSLLLKEQVLFLKKYLVLKCKKIEFFKAETLWQDRPALIMAVRRPGCILCRAVSRDVIFTCTWKGPRLRSSRHLGLFPWETAESRELTFKKI